MKKLLLSFAALLFGVMTAVAGDVSFHLVVNNASQLNAHFSYYDSQTYQMVEIPVELVDGDNLLSTPATRSLYLSAKDGCFLTSVTKLSNGETTYISNKTSTQIYIIDSMEGETFTAVTKSAAESRTASVTVNIDSPEKVNMMRYQISGYEFFSEPTTIVNYDPTDELPLQFGLRTGATIYKVTTSAGTVSESYGRWAVTPEDGATIDIQVEYPDVDVTYTLTSNIEGYDFIRVRAGSPLADVDVTTGSFTVKAGTQVEYTFNTTKYQITGFNRNGTPLNAYYSYSFVATGNTTDEFTVHEYGSFNTIVRTNMPDKLNVFIGSTYGTKVEAIDDVFTATLDEPYNTTIAMQAASGYYFADIAIDPAPENLQYTPNNFSYRCSGATEIYVELAEITNDCKVALFVDDAEALTAWSASSSFDYKQLFPDPATGYNVYEVSKAYSPATINWQTNEGAAGNIYLNGVLLSKEYEWSNSYTANFKDGDVLHLFVKGIPTAVNLTFDVEEGLEAEAIHNKVAKVADLASATALFQGDEVKVKVNAEPSDYTLTANDEPVIAGEDGTHTFNLAADTHVKVSKVSAIGETEADDTKYPVYNLQGIRVDSRNLPAGIYISNGSKFYVD